MSEASANQRVWVIEHRQFGPALNDSEEVVMHVASTKEKAHQWCREHLDAERIDPQRPWAFAIFSELVDAGELADDDGLHYLDWNGNVSLSPPNYCFEIIV